MLFDFGSVLLGLERMQIVMPNISCNCIQVFLFIDGEENYMLMLADLDSSTAQSLFCLGSTCFCPIIALHFGNIRLLHIILLKFQVPKKFVQFSNNVGRFLI